MNKTVIFAGTTEGRELSELLSGRGYAHIVCVAGDYGAEMLKDSPLASVHTGRMDLDEMTSFLQGSGFGDAGIVVDATHPYAAEVTRNIRAAADRAGSKYLRVIRSEESLPADTLTEYASLSDCAGCMDRTEGNILLTTGSKELHTYCGIVSDETKARTYVRVLPSADSLNLCLAEGIASDHIIAMQGPFTEEMNLAVLKQYRIRHLITKESGSAGGYGEKIRAAKAAGAEVHVIARPSKEEGLSVAQAAEEILGKGGIFPQSVVLAGIGMGDPMLQTVQLNRAIEEADAVFGARRLLEHIRCGRKYEMYQPAEIISVLEQESLVRPVILFSGDTGFYSGAGAMYEALRRWRPDLKIRIMPGISSVSYLAARLGKSYDHAKLRSIHGRNTDADIAALAEEVRYSPAIYALTSGAQDIRRIAKLLRNAGIPAELTAGSCLSYANERIEYLTPETAADYDAEGPVTLLITNPDPERRPLIRMFEDDAFIRGSIPMTKECVRHESIIRLGLKEGDLVYDIGGGTGSVTIEAAVQHPSVRVVSFERKPEAVELMRQNLRAKGITNVSVVEADACDVLEGMPAPDCVFIGGSGGKLQQIMKILKEKGKEFRCVITSVSLETTAEIMEILKTYSVRDERIVQLSVSEICKAGSHHMMRANNPVMIVSFTVPEES